MSSSEAYSSSRALALTSKELALVLANRLLAERLGSAALFVSDVPRGDIPRALMDELERRGRRVAHLDLEAIGDPPWSGVLDHFYSLVRAASGLALKNTRPMIWSALHRRTRKPLALVVESADRLVGDRHYENLLGTLKSVSEAKEVCDHRGLVLAFLGRDYDRMSRLVEDKRQAFFGSTLVKAPQTSFWP